jgi:hypothetical protein
MDYSAPSDSRTVAERIRDNNAVLQSVAENFILVSKADLYDSEQAAAFLEIDSDESVSNWLEGGYFPGAFQSDGRWLFPLASLIEVRERLDELQYNNKHRLLTPEPEPEDYCKVCGGIPVSLPNKLGVLIRNTTL